MSARLPQAQALPRQLPVQRDLALIVADTVTHDQVILAAQGPNQSAGQTGTSLLKQVLLFDVFKPAQPVAGMAAGEKSLAVRLVLGDDEQTLTDAQIDAEVKAVIGRMQSQVAARLRA
jgi:phenylalanyl-tRNA synthetase beta chain